MGGPVQYPKLQDEEWLRTKYAGELKSTRQIADVVGCHKSTVSNALEKFGIERRRGRSPDFPKIHDESWLREMCYQQRMSVQEIADHVGCSRDAVGKMTRKFGIRTPQSWPVEMRLPKEVSRSEVVAAYQESNSLAKAGNELGVSPGTVALWLDQLDVDRRRGVYSGAEHPSWNSEKADYYGENWWSQRHQALEDAGHECRVCGMSSEEHQKQHGFGLDVHHIQPLHTFDEPEQANGLSNLAVLCRQCHAKYEGVPILPKQDH